jgi:hypothetical protein
MVQDGGIWKVAGIHSGGSDDPAYSFGNISFAVNVSSHLDWINATMAALALPKLTLQSLGSGGFRLSWPSVASNFALQTQATLAGTNWVSAGFPVVDDGTNRSVVLTNTGPSGFWRLVRPPAARLSSKSSPARSSSPSASTVERLGLQPVNLLLREPDR